MGGTRDGVIAASRGIYGMSPGDATESVIRTFQQGISGGRDDAYLVLLEGANHFSIANPLDSTTASSFLDLPATHSEEDIRSLLAETISLFIATHVQQKPEASLAFKQLLGSNNPLIAQFENK